MESGVKERFTALWEKYFGGADLPVAFFYADSPGVAKPVKAAKGHRCILADIARVRSGRSIYFETGTVGCFGGRRYLGFSKDLMPNFEYFLSCGIPGEMEGERYKKSPELVRNLVEHMPWYPAPAPYAVFKRWDHLDGADSPDVVIFFDSPDVIAGVFTLASFDEPDQWGVVSPFGAGCATTLQYPYLEKDAERPKSFVGMFDVSARPCVRATVLSLAVPMKKFVRMVDNMGESFLTGESWAKVRRRIARTTREGK